jgi:F420-dependent oxidoreductase-like protein
MIEVAIMVEGQNGLNWDRWQRIVRAVEDFGFIGLYRSDHFTNANPPDLDSLELWVSLTWLAANTKRIEFGPLVTPVSFRHPTLTSRMAAAVDDLSGGRLTLGVGAGWQEREHANYGWDLLDITSRFQRFEEGLEVISRLFHSDVPVNFEGQFYCLKEAILLPRPTRPGGPPILVGGNGLKRTLPLAARFANEWNAVYISQDEFSQLNQKLDQLVVSEGRSPDSLRRSMMTGCVFGRDELEVRKKVKSRTQGNFNEHDLRQRGLVVGTVVEIADQLNQLSEAGVQRVMLQWLDLDDIPGLEALANGVLPQLD